MIACKKYKKIFHSVSILRIINAPNERFNAIFQTLRVTANNHNYISTCNFMTQLTLQNIRI